MLRAGPAANAGVVRLRLGEYGVAGRQGASRRHLIRLAGGGALLGTGGASLAAGIWRGGAALAQDRVFVRRNVYELDPNGPELRAYRRGITVMMARPADDPTSWLYQANIHGTTERRLRPAWNSCPHASWFFLSWHRMYLYWFERIVREASGFDRFALPYWNYNKAGQGALPSVFRRPTSKANVLYVAERSKRANDGTEAGKSTTSAQTAMAAKQFVSTNAVGGFGGPDVVSGDGFLFGLLEMSPHNGIHVWAGGDRGLMANPQTAARDPIFWLHHANIDRLWDVWLDLGGGRRNPTGEEKWMNAEFTFFDENGQRQRMSGKEVVDTVRQLDYRYDDLSAGDDAPADDRSGRRAAGPTAEADRTTIADRDSVVLSGRRATVTLAATARASSRQPQAPVLELADVSAMADVGFVYEVYVNLKPGTNPDFQNPSYVGSLSSFGLASAGQGGHAGHGAGKTFRFAIEGGLDGGSTTVTFVPVVTPERSNRGGDARIGRIAVIG